MLDLKVKYIRDVDHITQINEGNWIDLRCAETITLNKGEFAYIPLGIAMELPKGYEAIVAPRSSTFSKYKVLQVNGIGIIDESYCGDNDEWHFPAYAVETTVIPKGHRICQFRLVKRQDLINLLTVDKLGNKDRGGLGSTGSTYFVSSKTEITEVFESEYAKKIEKEYERMCEEFERKLP